MSTKLSHNATVPLWGFILIIGVGSIVIIGGVFMALRYYIKHHESDSDMIENDPETVRRVTVRRGRVVPQSHYMSLTGSRFGLGAFGIEDSRSGARSKSPFEWLNNAHARSNSQMSQLKSTTSNHSQIPEPTLTGDTPRKHAPSPLRSAASFESISEKPPSYAFLSKPASAHRSLRTTNFSRPALCMNSNSVSSSLPQIVETSPHQSMISSRQSKHSTFSEKAVSAVSELGVPRSPASFIGSRMKSHADISPTTSAEPPFDHHPAVKKQRSRTKTSRPAQLNHLSGSASVSRSPRPAHNGVEPSSKSRRPPAIQTEANPPIDEAVRRQSLPHSPRRSTSTLASKHSSTYRGPGDADNVAGQLSNASLQALPQLSTATDHSQAYWKSRQDLQPVRRKSQKGKVLRKKSLQRAERASWLE